MVTNLRIEDMRVVLYDSCDHGVGNKHFQKTIESKVLQKHLEIFHRIQDFIRRVHRIPREVDIAVLLAQNDEQLSYLVALKDILEGIPIILILPKWERATIMKGYLLNPKFIDFIADGFANVGPVLGKMMERINSQQIYLEGAIRKMAKLNKTIEPAQSAIADLTG